MWNGFTLEVEGDRKVTLLGAVTVSCHAAGGGVIVPYMDVEIHLWRFGVGAIYTTSDTILEGDTRAFPIGCTYTESTDANVEYGVIVYANYLGGATGNIFLNYLTGFSMKK
jgi:hypothetical protein